MTKLKTDVLLANKLAIGVKLPMKQLRCGNYAFVTFSHMCMKLSRVETSDKETGFQELLNHPFSNFYYL